MPPRPLPSLAYEHAQNAGFLWLLRDRATSEPHYSLADLTRLDRRVEAQLDALRLDPGLGWRAARKVLAERERPWKIFPVAFLAFRDGDAERVGRAVRLGTRSPAAARALAAALGWLPQSLAEPHIRALLATGPAALRRVGIAAAAAHRFNPGAALEKSVNDPDPLLRARALRAVGELGFPVWLPALRRHLDDPDPDCRFAAAWSAARLSPDPRAVGILQDVAFSHLPHWLEAAQVAVRRLDLPAANRWLGVLEHAPNGRRLSVQGAGILGDPAAVPRLLAAMQLPPLARAAGEALTFITGLDLDAEHLTAAPPKGFRAGPTDDPKDENVTMDEDEDLPWPDPEKVAAWWAANKSRFTEGVRYLCGQPLTDENLQRVLREGLQRQRAAAALELALRQPDRPLFEVRAPGFRQQQALAAG
ncbi:MAG TPA: TIGR02270 family protein [Gemmataceae bacterium]